MSAFDLTAPFTTAEIVAAAEGREGTMLRICREAAAQIEEKIRGRIAADGAALGKTQEEIDALLAGTSTAPSSPTKRGRAPKARPEAPADDAALLTALLAELDKGDASSLALAKRFAGLTKDRVQTVLFKSSNLHDGGPHVKTNGRKWSRVKP